MFFDKLIPSSRLILFLIDSQILNMKKLKRIQFFSKFFTINTNMENESKNPNDELQELMDEINALTSVADKNDPNSAQFNELLNQL